MVVTLERQIDSPTSQFTESFESWNWPTERSQLLKDSLQSSVIRPEGVDTSGDEAENRTSTGLAIRAKCALAERYILFSREPGTSESKTFANDTLSHILQFISDPASSEDEQCDLIDWDFYQPAPPPKRSGTIKVKLQYRGHSRPIPEQDPWE